MSHLLHNQATTLYVDPVFGVDAVAQRGSLHRPYATILAALTAASPGDTLRLSAGTFPEGIVMPNKSGIAIIGDGTQNTFITPPVGTDAFNWTPTLVGMNDLLLQGFTLRPSGTGRGLVLSGSLLPPGAPEFLYDTLRPKTSGAFLNRVNIEKTGTGRSAFIFRAGNIFVDSSIWSTASGVGDGDCKLEQPSLFVFTESLLTKGNFPTSQANFDYQYAEGPALNPAGGRQACVLVSSRIQGDIVLRGAPLFLMDSDSYCDIQVRGEMLTFTDVGPAVKHGPLILLNGTIGSSLTQGVIPFAGDVDFGTVPLRYLPLFAAGLFPTAPACQLDLLGARIYGVTTLRTAGAPSVRFPVRAKGTQFETIVTPGGVVIGDAIDLDTRGAMWRTESVFTVTIGSGTLDRSRWCISATALVFGPNIVPFSGFVNGPFNPGPTAAPAFPAGAVFIATVNGRVVGSLGNATVYVAGPNGSVTIDASAAGPYDVALQRV